MLMNYNDWFYNCKDLIEGEINYNYNYNHNSFLLPDFHGSDSLRYTGTRDMCPIVEAKEVTSILFSPITNV